MLAIDGGNSKTDVALVAADGTLLASARGPGDAQGLGSRTMVGVLGRPGRAAAAAQAGLPTAGPGADRRGTCRPAWPTPTCPRRNASWPRLLRAQGWTRHHAVANDTFAVLRAGLDGPGPHWGVGGHLRRRDQLRGRRAGRADHAGFSRSAPMTGDWGGGDGLGREAVWWAIRAEDGRGPQTALREAVAAHFGVASMYDVAVGLHTGKISRDALHGLVPVLFGVAGRRRRGRGGHGAAAGRRGLRHGDDRDRAVSGWPASRCRWCSAAGC